MSRASVVSLCLSATRGPKRPVERLRLEAGCGVTGDAHAKGGTRQLSALSVELVRAFARESGRPDFAPGTFGENLLLEGLDARDLRLGRRFLLGEEAVVQLSLIGKTCHAPCEIARTAGRCVMPTDGLFFEVLRGGELQVGDVLREDADFDAWRVAVVTVSDKGAAGEREDASGPAVAAALAELDGHRIVATRLIPDDRARIEALLVELCDETLADLVITTGGTGLSPRDVTPEATTAVATRLVPGMAEAMRQAGLAHTPHAMLSRAVVAQRNKSLIINLSGSPKAVREQLAVVVPVLPHALATASGVPQECARLRLADEGRKS